MVRWGKEEKVVKGDNELDEMLGKLCVEDGSGGGGVASSGWAGRSLSPGVADMVTVWAGSAGLADAAATFIAWRNGGCWWQYAAS